jgi:hypothetical protein
MRHLILASLLLLPAVAMADDVPSCKYHADRNLDLDLSGVRSVRFVVNAYDLNVTGNAGAGKGTIRGKACGSDQALVDDLIVTQDKRGDTLVVELTNKRKGWSGGWGSNYSYLKVDAGIPSTLPVVVETGSGDARVRGVASLESTAGSGDIEVYNVKGAVKTRIGSGDFKSDGTGSIEVDSVGSGDFTARNVHGDVRIGTVGSGDAKLTDVDGNVEVGTVGSGDVEVDGVKGNFTVKSKGSGDVEHHGVGGRVDVPNDR